MQNRCARYYPEATITILHSSLLTIPSTDKNLCWQSLLFKIKCQKNCKTMSWRSSPGGFSQRFMHWQRGFAAKSGRKVCGSHLLNRASSSAVFRRRPATATRWCGTFTISEPELGCNFRVDEGFEDLASWSSYEHLCSHGRRIRVLHLKISLRIIGIWTTWTHNGPHLTGRRVLVTS